MRDGRAKPGALATSPWQRRPGNGAMATREGGCCAPGTEGAQQQGWGQGAAGPRTRQLQGSPGGLGSARLQPQPGCPEGQKGAPWGTKSGAVTPLGNHEGRKKTTKQPLPPPRLISPGLVRSCKQVHASPAALRTHVPALPVPGQLLQPVPMRLVAVAQQMRSLGPGAQMAPGELPLLRQQSSGRATRPRVRTHAPRARTALPARLSSSFQPC